MSILSKHVEHGRFIKLQGDSLPLHVLDTALPGAGAPPSFGWKDWLLAALLLAAVFAVYQPAWHGGLIWDDDAHLTAPELQSWRGLYRIWWDIGATQQYYPLLHSVFWIEHKLWGESTLGYHLVNILLHSMAALMVVLILRRLFVPGAWLAGIIFALHPVHVESVAWISELKNTLSTVLYLGAMLSYLRFDHERRPAWYGAALSLFLLAMLSKTVAASFPAALLVIFWWKQGRLRWKEDVLWLLPFFVTSVAGGMLTAWVERKLIGAEGVEFSLTWGERWLVAGRAFWFYLGKLLWPTELIFIYPRWEVRHEGWGQYGFLIAFALLMLVLWKLRRHVRAPLAAMLFFIGSLFPALGFFNVYPFVFSFVADHFQYLASLGVISLVSAGLALQIRRKAGWRLAAGRMGCATLVAVLATLTYRQSRLYSDVETLYRKTIDSNPLCWMAHGNLGVILARRGQCEEAIVHYRQALTIKSDYADAHYNLADVLADQGAVDEAVFHYNQALNVRPRFAKAHNNLGNVLVGCGQCDEAMWHYKKALEALPNMSEAHNGLGVALAQVGHFDAAVSHLQQAIVIKPDFSVARLNLELVRALQRQAPGAAGGTTIQYQNAVEVRTNKPAAR